MTISYILQWKCPGRETLGGHGAMAACSPDSRPVQSVSGRCRTRHNDTLSLTGVTSSDTDGVTVPLSVSPTVTLAVQSV